MDYIYWEDSPIYTRLARETGIREAQNAFHRLACGTDEVSTALRHNRSPRYAALQDYLGGYLHSQSAHYG